MPNMRETTNIIIALRRKGWSEMEINDFIVFIETHHPTEKEAEEAKKKNTQKKTAQKKTTQKKTASKKK